MAFLPGSDFMLAQCRESLRFVRASSVKHKTSLGQSRAKCKLRAFVNLNEKDCDQGNNVVLPDIIDVRPEWSVDVIIMAFTV